MSAQTAWPEGVIGRYLTVGGATVDLIEGDIHVTVTCQACPDASWIAYDSPSGSDNPDRKKAVERAGDWAQGHAETCRAMPKPDAV